MNGASPQRRPRARPLPVPREKREEGEEGEEGEGYAWNYYGRDAVPEDLDPSPVRPPLRERRRRPAGDDGRGR